MNINFTLQGENYRVNSDSHNLILKKISTVKFGDNTGSETESVVGYFPTMEGLFDHLVELSLRHSEATSFSELIALCKKNKAELDALLKGAANEA